MEYMRAVLRWLQRSALTASTSAGLGADNTTLVHAGGERPRSSRCYGDHEVRNQSFATRSPDKTGLIAAASQSGQGPISVGAVIIYRIMDMLIFFYDSNIY